MTLAILNDVLTVVFVVGLVLHSIGLLVVKHDFFRAFVLIALSILLMRSLR